MKKIGKIEPFLDDEGKITQFPQKRVARRLVLEYLADKFVMDRSYTEPEVNVICEDGHTFGDYFLLRRELVEAGLLGRTPNGARYWRVKSAEPEAADAQPEA